MALLETHFYSHAIDLSIGTNIILPEHANAWNEPPAVLYLLHGLSGDHTSWCRNSSIERYVRNYNLVVVMPDAHKSFYSDMKHGSDYWNLMSNELPALINRWFNVSPDKNKTYVAGSSMGGYGAMKLALGCPEKFAAAISLSGALDLSAHIDDDWDESRSRTFESVFGKLAAIPGSENDLIAQLQNLDAVPDTAFYVACGTEDYLYQDSINFRNQATEAGLRLTYEESAGDHEWGFWDSYIQRMLEWLPIKQLESEEE